VGEIGDPERIRRLDAEVATDEVGPTRGLGIGLRRAPRLATALGALDAVLAHQSLHAAAPDRLAGAAERLPHPPVAVGVVVLGVNVADPSAEALVLDRPS
jgi:cobalamin biosynthesis protein CbiG